MRSLPHIPANVDAPEPDPLIYGLCLSIGGTCYGVVPIDPGEDGPRAYRLNKRPLDGTVEAVYDVLQAHDGHAACDCPDFVFRREGTDPAGCKHVKALRHFGLIAEAPEIVQDATTAPVAECCPASEPTPCAACLEVGTPIPTEGEGKGAEGPDLGPADPADDFDGDDQLDAPGAGWDDFDDSARWNLGPAPRTFSMAEVVAMQVRGYEAWGNELGDILAHHMKALADELGIVQAATPDQWLDRRAALAEAN